MKVIGKTINGYMVEATADELAAACGFGSSYNDTWRRYHGHSGEKLVGATLEVETEIRFHNRVKQHQKEAGSAANTLRALADLIGGALPDVVIPAGTEEKADD